VSGLAIALIGCAAVAPPVLPTPRAPAVSLFGPQPALTPSASSAPAPELTPKAPVLAQTPGAGALPAISQGDIGGSGPLELLATSSSGAWVALCEGEPLTAKLILGSGSGEPIDSLDAADPSGRYVVTTRAGVTALIDANDGTRVNLSELGADLRRARSDYAEHRSLSFDAAGSTFAYLRRRGATSDLVVRQLATGVERAFAVGTGDVYRMRLSADGRYAELDTLRADTNSNGKLDWPTPEETKTSACGGGQRAPQFRSFRYQGRGDVTTRALLTLPDGAVRDVPELVTTLGTSLLVRGVDGALMLEQADKRRLLAPASCAGRVVFADAERGLVLAACQPPKKKTPKGTPSPVTGKRELWLFGSGFAKSLQSELYETSVDRDSVVGVRLVPVYPGSAAALLDLEQRELLPLAAGSRVLSTVGTRALIWRDNDLYGFDALSKTEQRLARGVAKTPELLRAGTTVLLSPFVVVGASGPVLESPPGALAVSVTGHVLVSAGPAAPTGQAPSSLVISGPLHWHDARLAPLDGPSR
jgi:hypothetical protein